MSQEKAQPDQAHAPQPRANPSGLKMVTLAPESQEQEQAQSAPPPPPPPPAGPDTTTAPPPPSLDPYLGCTIDNRYKVEALLGEGGMGMVYLCRHKIIHKPVALKILRADLARDQEVTERFLMEARAASSIGSEHIIDISDFGQLPDGSAYFVMEFLEGQPLSAVVEPMVGMPLAQSLHVAAQLCVGLAAAHAAGIVHRDLKPDNIYLVHRGEDPHFVKILDFGIAKVTTAATDKLTQAGSVFGTPHYMSPEQAAGSAVDQRGDIYSIGVILYEMASGQVPFDADNFMGILTQHMYRAPPSLRALERQNTERVPPGLEAIILKCLSKKPSQRYQTCAELRQDLERLRTGQIPLAVDEMLGRAEGFEPPPDFFNQHAAQAANLPSTTSDLYFEPRKRSWPLYVGIGAPLLVAAVIFLSKSNGTSTTEASNVNQASAAGIAATLGAHANATPMVQVAIGIEPVEAHAFVEGRDLGPSPVLLDIHPGQSLEVTIRHEGYRDEKIVVDDSTAKMAVKLKKLSKPSGRPVSAPRKATREPGKQKAKPLGAGDIVDPWETGSSLR